MRGQGTIKERPKNPTGGDVTHASPKKEMGENVWRTNGGCTLNPGKRDRSLEGLREGNYRKLGRK